MKKSQLLLICTGLLLSQYSLADTLQNVIQKSVDTNPEVQITAKDRCAVAEALAGARAGYFPSLDANASIGIQHTDNPFTQTPVNQNMETLDPRQVGLTADQMLFDGFGTPNRVKQNEALLSSASYKVRGSAEDVALAATESYLNVLKEQRLLNLSQQNLDTHAKIVTLISKRSESGIDLTADVNQAEGRLALAESNNEAEEENYINAQASYLQVVGEMPNHLSMPTSPFAHNLPHSENDAIQMALSNHPLLKSSKADMSAAYADHKAAYSPNYPRLDLQLNAIRGQDINGVEGQNNQETAQVVLNYNLFNGGADKAKQQETAYLYQKSGAVMHNTYRLVIENVQIAWNAWKTAQDQLPLLKKHRDDSLKTFKAYEQQFQLGKRSLLDLLDAQSEYYEASRSYINGQFVLLLTQFNLLNSTGSLLNAEGITPPTQATQPQFS